MHSELHTGKKGIFVGSTNMPIHGTSIIKTIELEAGENTFVTQVSRSYPQRTRNQGKDLYLWSPLCYGKSGTAALSGYDEEVEII